MGSCTSVSQEVQVQPQGYEEYRYQFLLYELRKLRELARSPLVVWLLEVEFEGIDAASSTPTELLWMKKATISRLCLQTLVSEAHYLTGLILKSRLQSRSDRSRKNRVALAVLEADFLSSSHTGIKTVDDKDVFSRVKKHTDRLGAAIEELADCFKFLTPSKTFVLTAPSINYGLWEEPDDVDVLWKESDCD